MTRHYSAALLVLMATLLAAGTTAARDTRNRFPIGDAMSAPEAKATMSLPPAAQEVLAVSLLALQLPAKRLGVRVTAATNVATAMIRFVFMFSSRFLFVAVLFS